MARLRLALLLLAVAAGACRSSSPPAPPRTARHLVIVTIDTLRADRVGAYGYRAATTPELDRLALEGALARDASAHVPLTRPSHVSLFTGLLPAKTGVRDNISPAVVPSVPLVAERLKQAGFATAAFVSSVVLDSSSGLDRGFDTYSDAFEGGGGEPQFLSTVQKRGDRTTAEAVAWLDAWLERTRTAAPAGRVFLWLHLYDPHDPYEPPEPHASRHEGRPYDGEVAWSDELVGRLDVALARLGLREETLLVVTSDHGEGLGDHGETLHGFFTYESTLAVPFIVRGPGVRPGTRLSGTVRLVDVFPTVLDLLGVAVPAGTQLDGTSLAGALRAERALEEHPVYAESLVPLLHFGWSDLRVLREGRWKYIQAPRPELYDLRNDPGERTNLANAEAPRATALRAALGRFLDAERRATKQAPAAAAVPPELLEKLGALGYVGGSAAAETRTPGADPKDRIEDFRVANDLIRQGLLSLHDRDYPSSIARFRTVLARGIASFEVHFYLARGLAGAKRYAEAARHFEEAVRRAPAHGSAWEGLAQSLAAVGRRDEARRAYEAALPLAPRSARLRAQLGELLRDMGEVEAAIARQREAVELAPTTGALWNSLGMTLGGNGRVAEAEQAFREAFRLDDRNHRHAYNLGLILLRQGRAAEARPYFEKALVLAPDFAPARARLRDAGGRPTAR